MRDRVAQRAAACVERVRELNPLVTVEVHSGPLPASSDAGFWGGFTAVCTSGLPLGATLAASAACRAHGALFFAGSQHGLVCTFEADLGASHAFKLTDASAQAGGVGTAFKEAEGAAVSSVAYPPFAEVSSAPLAAAASMLSRRRTRDPSAASNDAAPAWVAVTGEVHSPHPEAATLLASLELQRRHRLPPRTRVVLACCFLPHVPAAAQRALSVKGLERPPEDRAAFAAELTSSMTAELAAAPGLLDADAVS